MSNGSGAPLQIPPGYDLGLARTCSFVVNVACDMCEQWKAAGCPPNGFFQWQPADTCPVTNSVFDVGDFTFSGPIWSNFILDAAVVSEPFGVLARSTSDPQTLHLAFRGSQTDADTRMDLQVELVDYPPPTTPTAGGVKVERGFYGVFSGIDRVFLDRLFLTASAAGTRLIVSGHSLGSALATLAVPLARANGITGANTLHYNQASPRVGDRGFQSYYDSLDVTTFRLVNTYDVVPKSPPPPYVAVGVEAPFGADYGSEAERHNPCCSYSYALFNPTAPVNPGMGACMAASKPELHVP